MATGKRKAGKGTEAIRKIAGAMVEYHVVPHGSRWDVERDDAFTGSFAFDVNTAIGLATSAAKRELNEWLDVMVCVQQPDGSCRKVWP